MAGSSEPKGDKKGEKMDLSSDAADSKVPSVDYSEQIGQQQALARWRTREPRRMRARACGARAPSWYRFAN